MNESELGSACRKIISDVAADPDAMAKLPVDVRREVAERAGVWTIERLRGMTRGQFNEAVKRDGPPPIEMGLQLITERLGLGAR